MMRKSQNKLTKRLNHKQQLRTQHSPPEAQPFLSHVYELRKRLFYIAVCLVTFGGAAAFMQDKLIHLLLKPAGNQQFIYTSPGGGFDFTFTLCLYTGVALSIPAIIYNLLVYVQPLLKKQTVHFILSTTAWSTLLAFIGMLFGYFVSLPAGLHFLLHGFFSGDQIKAVIEIQKYLAFVVAYLVGSALLFQVPLVLILINRIMPLPPGKLLSYQRWVVVGSFVIGAVISPTPDIKNQAIMSFPIIVMYNLSVLIIWFVNRKHRRPKRVAELLRKDAELQAVRQANFEKAQVTWQQSLQNAIPAGVTTATKQVAPSQAPSPALPQTRRAAASRPQQYLQSFDRSRSYIS